MTSLEKFYLFKENKDTVGVGAYIKKGNQDTLRFLKAGVECDQLAVTHIGNGLDIISDDEALRKKGSKIIISFDILGKNLEIPGNCILAGVDDSGNTKPVTNKQWKWFKKNVKTKYKKVMVGV